MICHAEQDHHRRASRVDWTLVAIVLSLRFQETARPGNRVKYEVGEQISRAP